MRFFLGLGVLLPGAHALCPNPFDFSGLTPATTVFPVSNNNNHHWSGQMDIFGTPGSAGCAIYWDGSYGAVTFDMINPIEFVGGGFSSASYNTATFTLSASNTNTDWTTILSAYAHSPLPWNAATSPTNSFKTLFLFQKVSYETINNHIT